MKKFLLSALALASCISIWADSTLDLNSRVALRRARLEQQSADGMRRIKGDAPKTNVLSAIVQLAPGSTAADLEGDGVRVLGSRHGFAFVVVDVDKAEDVSRLKCVRRMELGRTRSLKLDKARAASGVDKIHAGIDLPQPYTGKGVIAGIVDGGFDPNHINFRNSDGSSRFGQFTTVDINVGGIASGSDPVIIRKYTRDEISQYHTDDNTQYHGTHTLGIMAGGYRGNASIAVQTDAVSSENKDMATPYYGVAYDADIVASSGASQDGLIAYAIDQLLEYRYSQDKPIVINLSLGGNQGPHDGTGMLSQYMDACAEEENAIFCLSAGNEGDLPISLNKTFSETDTEMKSFIRPYVYNDMRYGIVEFYSDDNQEFEVQAVIYNISRGRIAKRYAATNAYACSSAEYQITGTDIIDTSVLGKYFEGYIGVNYAVDASGRYSAGIDYYLVNNDNNSPNEGNENYLVGFVVKGKPGQRIYAYCDGDFTALDSYADKDITGWSEGMCNGSISDLATGHNIISVGSYNTRNSFAGMDGHMYSTEFTPGLFPVGDITNFSSFGTLADGRELPMIVAPGATVISSFSNPYMRNPENKQNEGLLSGNFAEESRNNYYIQMQGTSMAAPYVAGSIALWLEAYPELTYSECIDIVKRTAIRDDAYDRLAPTHIGQGGLGKFDAYNGLKEVLKLKEAGIGSVSADRTKPLVVPVGDRAFSVSLPGEGDLRADLYDLSGRRVLSASGVSELRLDCTGLAPGVYALRVNSASTRILVR